MKTPCLRIASYNLQKCVGLDMRRRPDRSLGVIALTGADIVLLQEADKRIPPRPAALPADMARADGWQVLPFGAPGGSLGWHGNAMLARDGITLTDTSHIELPGLEPRGAILAEIECAIGPVRLVGVHLGLVRRYRLMQVAGIMRHLRTLPEMATVMAGDFNEWGSPAALDATAQGVHFLSTPASFPAPRPVARLDRIAVSPDLTATAIGTIRTKPAHIASDHLPVWADITRSTA